MTRPNWPIIGHDWAVELLAARLAHGRAGAPVVFTGPEGVGRTTLARLYAQALQCTGAEPPCGACRACQLNAQGRHPDVHVVEPQLGGKVVISAELKIEQIRQLQQILMLTPVEANRRIALLRRMETATAGAANALLKTLEEPPGEATLLLTASDVDALWPTIVSRCQVIPLRPLALDLTARALTARWLVPEARALELAHLSGGRLGWAVRAAQDPDMLTRREDALAQLREALAGGRVERFACAERVGRDTQRAREALDVWTTWWRDVLLQASGSQAPLTHRALALESGALAKRVGPQSARGALDALARARGQIERNAPARLVLEVLLLDFPR